jgi:hypothetical protein
MTFQRLPLTRFDWTILIAFLVLSVSIAIVLGHGDRTQLQVTDFSWAGRKIGVADRAFRLAFNRPVDHSSVEQHLSIEPSLPGKISWAGGNLFYTLSELPIYGLNYQLKLQDAQTQDGSQRIEPFVSLLNTRDRAFAYIGIAPEERGQLVLYNITQKSKKSLTPRDLVITAFKIYPDGSKLVFSAFERGQTLDRQALYTVTTGLNFQNPERSQTPGRFQRLLEAKDYQNQRFDLSANGKLIIVQRTNRRNPAESGLWILSESGEARPLGVPGGEFLISPDSRAVGVTQRNGVSLIPLTPDAGPPQFFPGYEALLGFSKDGSKKLMVKANPDYTRSLLLLSADGSAKELFKSLNPILSCLFEPRHEKTLYCLKADVVPTASGQYREEPYLAAIDVETAKDFPLLALPNYRDVQMSMSPDGVALLFDQVIATLPGTNDYLMTQGGQAIADGRLWLFTLPELEKSKDSLNLLPEELNPGFKPQWMP